MSQPKQIIFAFALGMGILGNGVPAQAQETDTIGPPDLRNFSIGGERATPPPPAEEPAVVAPPPVVVPEQSATPATPPDTSRPVADTPSAAPRQAQQDRTERPSDAVPSPATSAAMGDRPVTKAPPAPVADPAELQQPASATSTSEGGVPWLYIFLAMVGAGLTLLVLLRLRKNSEGIEAEAPVAEEAMSWIDPAPPVKVPGPRPWLELEFKPGKAAATDAQASVEYELKIANVGGADARKVRIEARLFNAQQDAEIGAFFSTPDPAQAAAAPRVIPPQGGAVFRSVVALPKDQLREVVIQGRRLFIPMVAFNVLYEWGDGEAGQTSMSYIVGRETEPPAEKMAPFRLDLGPRIYRSVGFRPSKLALTV